MNDWTHRDEWRKRGEKFLVTITRHAETTSDFDPHGPNRWCVYAYIYSEHALFSKFVGEDLWQAATENIPFHGGCSFCRKHMSAEGICTSYQVGADYSHLGDEEFSRYVTQDDAAEAFSDAQRLVNYLEQYK